MLAIDAFLPLSQDHLTAIGRVTAYFSLLEQEWTTLIANLLQLKSREDVISLTAHMNASTKIQLIETLSRTNITDTALAELLKEVVKKSQVVNQERNEIVHAHWYYYSSSKNESGHLKQTARGIIKTRLEGYTPEQIDAIALRIFEVTAKIQQLLLKKNGALSFS